MSLRVRCCAFRISDPLRSGEVPSIPRGLAFSWKGEGWLVGWGRRIRMEETYTMRGEREERMWMVEITCENNGQGGRWRISYVGKHMGMSLKDWVPMLI